MRICIKPLGIVDVTVLDFLQSNLAKVFGECDVLHMGKIPPEAYNPMRGQYNSTTILENLEPAEGCHVLLGVTEEDIYAGKLNFVFGEAELNGSRAIISLSRLNPNIYGMKNGDSLKIRALKEAMHEIGHVLGLAHCSNPRCVMHFSNSIFDTDAKDWKYCDVCRERLESRGVKVRL
ncbi:archaemetzincin family Zn-dependent metalloprotease [Archaeoglobus veneficus]|uniref:Archaemetzincin n=1 Tax=Archaeoglobus veneficus (strain DSM 11195 / SNP6) TaxID=693661 RepID=F2KNK3_ARCVS|nr:archaemetzincin family Zn-dependent metalloprotease [Archaeoglobus veneficus]AEA46231.1 Archemetzincin [Archaeoglobus veneficus SNP6]